MIISHYISWFIQNITQKQIVKWFITVLSGLFIDLTIFYILSSLGLIVYMANLISAGIAIIFLYIRSLRFVFKEKIYSKKRFILFITYYFLSINFFSLAISILVIFFGLPAIVAKIATLPVSFFINYFFASKIV